MKRKKIVYHINFQKGFTTKPIGFWNEQNMREHMVSFASGLNLYPLLPETWIKLAKTFRKSKVFK